MISEIQQQLTQIKTTWDAATVLPEEFTSLGYPGLTKVEVSDLLSGVIELLDEVNQKEDFKPSLISLFNLQKTVSTLYTYVSSHIPSSPQPHIPEALRLLELTSTTIREWLEESDKVSKRATTGLINKLAEATKKVEDAAAIRDELRSYQADMGARTAVAIDQAEQIATLLADSITNKNSIETHSVTSAETFETSKADADEIHEFTEEIATLKLALADAKEKQDSIFEKFESYRDKIELLLGDANRAGLAASFRARKVELEDPLKWWLGLFVASVLGLVIMAVLYFAPILQGGELKELPFRLALVSPFIWLGWFSAKQYGYTARLREDYAYKEASAMSFEGYKREAGESSVEMLEKLLDVSINNFSDNPIRIYSGTGNHASPLHELVDKTPDLKKLMEDFKAFLVSSK